MVTPFGMVTLLSELQQLNALSPMVVTLPGMLTLSSDSHKKNAPSPMLVSPVGRTMLVRAKHLSNEFAARLCKALSSPNVMLVSDSHE